MPSTATRALTIGRNATNQIVIADPGVSGRHARATALSENVWLLEDLHSTNGTEVDGLRIQRALITAKSRIVLGKQHVFDAGQLFHRKPLPDSPEAIQAAFRQLEQVYAEYQRSKVKAAGTSTTKKTVFQAGAMLVGSVALGVIPFVGGAMVGGAIGAAFGQILASHFINPAEKQQALDEEFKLQFVCPNPACGQFLGMGVPYKSLVRQRLCRHCKTEWVPLNPAA